MDLKTAKMVVNDDSLTDDQLSILVIQAKKEALNKYYWHPEDKPSEDEIDAFCNKYEFEIYAIAKAMDSDDARDGLISHSELGISRTWAESSKVGVDRALAAIPTKVYVM